MNASTLRIEIDDLEKKLRDKRLLLEKTETECQHRWGQTEPDHIYRAAYTIPGDAPGTMGVDWRGPVHVAPETANRWKRVCCLCGKIEHTSKTTQQVKHVPEF